MVAYNILLVSWAFRYVPVLEVVLARDRQGIAERLTERFRITNREQEIIALICRGKTNQEIADTLFISLQTVKDHNHNIFRKTGVSNRVQIARLFSKP
jgi:DNA-binding NarL/FixJ family response regulator